MKDIVKLLLVIICGGVGAGLPITGFYLLWSWCMTQVPLTLAYAGLIKVGITLGMVAAGISVTIGLAILGGLLAGSLAVALLD